jgi:type IV secretion system protein VirD4
MDNNVETNTTDSTEPLVGEVLSKPVTVSSLYDELIVKRKFLEEEKKNKKKDKKDKEGKSKKDLDLELYDDYIGNYNIRYPDSFDPFLREQSRLREGNVIPEVLEMGLYEDSGFFFGMKNEKNVFIGKPAHKDGHIMIVGFPGSGKTEGIVKPTLMTWKGIQIIIDVKGDLYGYWALFNKPKGKKVKIFNPSAPKGGSCGYDPYAPLRHGGAENLAGNARDLALALMPLMPSIKDPIWIQATQNFLTGVFIYYFELGWTFVDTMLEIQISSITDIIEEIKNDDNIAAKIYMSKLNDVQDKVVGNTGMELSNLAALVTDPAILNIFCVDEKCGQIDWADLNTATEPFDIILVFSEANMERWGPLMKLMLNQLIKSLEQRPPRTYNKGKEAPPVLVMIDEFPRLGKISAIKNGLATLRSRGVTFALFVQSLADLDETYGPTAARVIADICAYKIVLGVTDPTSQEYFSKAVGTTESTQRSVSANHDPFSGKVIGYGRTINENREPIIYPHEFLTLKDVVVINPYSGFFLVNKTLFIENEEMFLLPQLSKNPDYRAKNPLSYYYK